MKVISIVGAKAGCGATTTAVNVALRLSVLSRDKGERVCVVDAAPYGAFDVGFLLGTNSPLRTDVQLVSHHERLIADRVPGYLHLARANISALALTCPDQWADVLPMLCAYSTIIVDGWVAEADHVFMVVSPDPMVLREVGGAISNLRMNLVSQQRLSFLVNGDSNLNDGTHDAIRTHCDEARILSIRCDTDGLRHAALSGSPLANQDTVQGIVAEWDAIAHAITTLEGHDPHAVVEKEALVHHLLAEFQERNASRTDAAPIDQLIAAGEVRRMLADIPECERAGIDADAIVTEVLHEALGLGPLEPLMADDGITEIMVNGPHQIFVERAGRLETLNLTIPEKTLSRIIERILAPLGRRVDESSPMVDARLPDGSRVNVVVPPLALNGPTLTIRRFSPTAWRLEDLIRMGSTTPEVAEFLRSAIRCRKNIVVSGGTGSGKTTLLNVLSAEIPEDERIITIEDAAELRLTQPHVVRLESRPPNLEGKGAVTIRDLLRNALRMRPNRIIVGECRGGEAIDMLQAMNTGHDGSLTTLHANSPSAALSRLETLVMFAGMELPARAIRDQIAGAIQLIVQISRRPDGKRVITEVAEVTGDTCRKVA